MCTIKYIERVDNQVVSDRFIKTSNKDFDLIDKPYYVIKDTNASSVIFTFHYLEAEEEVGAFNDNNFRLRYGMITGRLLDLSIVCNKTDNVFPNNKVKLEYWSCFENTFERDLRGGLSDERILKIKHAFEIIIKLYFEKFSIVEEKESLVEV